jgi:hypothetical protein
MVNSHVAVATLDEAEGGRMEEGSEDRVQEPTEDFLADSVFYPMRFKKGWPMSGFTLAAFESDGQRCFWSRRGYRFS